MPLPKVLSDAACLVVLVLAIYCSAAQAQSTDQKTDVPPMKNKPDLNAKRQAAGLKMNQMFQAAHVTTTSQPPADFPVPAYPGCTSVMFLSQQDIKGATMKTSDVPSVACNWYKQSLSQGGWAIQPSPTNLKNGGCVVTATKNDQRVTINCSQPQNSPLTIISINVVKVPPVFQKK